MNVLAVGGAALGGLAVTLVLAAVAPRLMRRRARAALAPIAGAAGLLAMLAPGAPTGLLLPDLALRAGLAVAVTVVASGARRYAWVVAGALAIAGAPIGQAALLAGALLGAAVATVVGTRWGTLLGAVWGAAMVQVLLHLGGPEIQGAPSVLAGLAVLALGVGWYQAVGARDRRRARRGLAGAGALAGLFLVGMVAAAVTSANGLRQAAIDTEAALVAAADGDARRAADLFDRAAGDLAEVEGRLGSWWVRPLRVVPVGGRYLADTEIITRAASQAVASAGAVAERSSSETLTVRDGVVPLGALTGLAADLDRAGPALARLQRSLLEPTSAPWLPAAVTTRFEDLAGRLDRARDDVTVAQAAVEVAPGLLGADGARSWFLAVHSPSELRGAGGVIGNYGEVTTSGGAVDLVDIERIRALQQPGDVADRSLSPDVAAGLARYAGIDVTRFFQNALQSPDFTLDARAIEQLSPQSGGPEVRGVIAVDPLGLAALLRLTGPVQVPSWPVPITAANAPQILLFEQYVALEADGADSEAREDFLAEVTEEVVDRLTTGVLAPPADIARALAPAVRAKHLLLHSVEPREQEVIELLGASGWLAPLVGDDFVQVVTQNTTQTKMDWFLERDVTYRPTYDPTTGTVEAELTVTLRNASPADGLPDYVIGAPDRQGRVTEFPPPGHNRLAVAVYSPLGLQGATLGGQPVVLGADRELDRNVYTGLVTIAPGESATLQLTLRGAIAAAPTYRLVVGAQPLVTPDRVAVEPAAVPGWRVASGSRLDHRRGGDVVVEVPVRPMTP